MPYSHFNATVGSTRVARRVGRRLANTAMADRSAATPMNVGASTTRTPIRNRSMTGVIMTVAARPTARPIGTIDGVSGTGEKVHWEYTAQYDGKDVKVTGNPDADMLAMTRTSARVTETVYKKAGKVTLTNRRTVSADGKTLTVTQTRTNAQGQKVNNTIVYTKG